MLFVGVDWGETHDDLWLLDEDGTALTARRIPDGLTGVAELHVVVAAHAQDPGQVAVGSRPTVGCWSVPCWSPATRSMRSTRMR